MLLFYLFVYSFLGIFLLVFDVLFFIMFISSITSALGGAPFVPIPQSLARAALNLAQVKANDTIYDLGSGDGRVLRIAVQEFGVKKAVGYEISLWPHLLAKAKKLFLASGEQSRIELHHGNYFKTNLSQATLVYLYLYPKLMENLRMKLTKELPKEARVVSCRFPFPNREADKETVADKIKIYLYSLSSLSTLNQSDRAGQSAV